MVHGVGGSFDIMAGLTRRAPGWYQKLGLEWLYRVQQEPLRLGRRYLTTNVSFLALLAAEMLKAYTPGRNAPAYAPPPMADAKAGPASASTSGDRL